MNRYTDEEEIEEGRPKAAVRLGDRGTRREQAEKTAYRDAKGNLFIPGPNVFAALIAAGKFHKTGKRTLTTARSSLIPAGIVVNELEISLGTKKFEVDSRSVVNPSTGGRIMKHRARIDDWTLSFSVTVDQDMFAEKVVRALLDDAGKKIGLGDFRPDRKGPFGKFVVVLWEKVGGGTNGAVESTRPVPVSA